MSTTRGAVAFDREADDALAQVAHAIEEHDRVLTRIDGQGGVWRTGHAQTV
jgi:hypothetical protein